ncbi:hypothetical protein QK412_10080 [Pseudomonas aeruginosa]|nr:hypothetical protein [Pseudomonas aeruginosa]
MSELLFLRFLIGLLAAYLLGVMNATPHEYKPCWLSPEQLECWTFAATPAESARHER